MQGARATPGVARADSSAPPTVTPVGDAVLRAALDEWRSDVGPPGATLSVRVPGYDDIHLASGTDGGDPMATDDTYGIASVTKTFTAALALQLVQEGQLSLDEPIERSPIFPAPVKSPSTCCSVTPPISVTSQGYHRSGSLAMPSRIPTAATRSSAS
jgi:hypothetical protein